MSRFAMFFLTTSSRMQWLWAASLALKPRMGSLMEENHPDGTRLSRSASMNFFGSDNAFLVRIATPLSSDRGQPGVGWDAFAVDEEARPLSPPRELSNHLKK